MGGNLVSGRFFFREYKLFQELGAFRFPPPPYSGFFRPLFSLRFISIYGIPLIHHQFMIIASLIFSRALFLFPLRTPQTAFIYEFVLLSTLEYHKYLSVDNGYNNVESPECLAQNHSFDEIHLFVTFQSLVCVFCWWDDVCSLFILCGWDVTASLSLRRSAILISGFISNCDYRKQSKNSPVDVSHYVL